VISQVVNTAKSHCMRLYKQNCWFWKSDVYLLLHNTTFIHTKFWQLPNSGLCTATQTICSLILSSTPSSSYLFSFHFAYTCFSSLDAKLFIFVVLIYLFLLSFVSDRLASLSWNNPWEVYCLFHYKKNYFWEEPVIFCFLIFSTSF
jgi:hypothetical protein